ncbi:LssY C-terminal domain-containing protein [Cryobacterium sp. 10S3]|uniref:LssY C-terminal domain-containing protein n=1 Tax=Cryobacterium sp. 10S3 TaxID=3048582 RepID=UPI002AC905EE|nr:LssY C-terminal domain-containing protein [Cryobacterium sp. 10S3]MEB0285410.1 LssY C-terminal domain-containing protein [Cryobacterium sp. 10S3]WPX13338.1 LssY C-terminal domain-containing protein [Cryobacterium sp. 10S3]
MTAAVVPEKVRVVPRRLSVSAGIDAFFFVFAGFAAVWLAVLLVNESFQLGWGALWFAVLFWVLLAYLVLPRLHRILTQVYVPHYFIGRTRTSDGLLGDPVNLAITGTAEQLQQALAAAGWTRADDITPGTTWRMVSATLARRSYDEAPVSPLFLFDRMQDFAYQQEVAENPAKRHHVRFWRCPDGWLLPGGTRVDWLAAGTFDRAVGFSLFTLQITHKIDENTDIERDHIVDSLLHAGSGARVHLIRDFSSGYHARNGGGDTIQTDGDLPVVDVSGIAVSGAAAARAGSAAPEPAPTAAVASASTVASTAAPTGNAVPSEPGAHRRRPASISVGALMLGARVLSGLGVIVLAALDWPEFVSAVALDGTPAGTVDPATAGVALGILLAGYGVVLALNIGFAAFVYFGRNWARIVAMSFATVSIVTSFVDYAVNGAAITLRTSLVSVTFDILILLALSARDAREFARARPVRNARGRRAP